MHVVFVALFPQGSAALPMLRTVEIVEFNGDWLKLFESWNNYPEQCPVLETLSISTQINDATKMKDFAFSTHKYSIPTVKKLDVDLDTTCCCSTVPFSMFVAICKVFPNLETASLTLHTECEHNHTRISEMYECFKRFNPKVKLTFNFKLYHNYAYSGTKRDRLHERLLEFNKTIDTSFGNSTAKYSVTASRPNRTMNFRIKVRQQQLCESFRQKNQQNQNTVYQKVFLLIPSFTHSTNSSPEPKSGGGLGLDLGKQASSKQRLHTLAVGKLQRPSRKKVLCTSHLCLIGCVVSMSDVGWWCGKVSWVSQGNIFGYAVGNITHFGKGGPG
uniref:Secreted protein n=1 Tax=Panagrellus redivivus TaxID=6233 RepID=A0A7E4VM76_PANRE